MFGYYTIISLIDLTQTDDASSYQRYFTNAHIMIRNYGLRVLTNDVGYLATLVLLQKAPIAPNKIIYILSIINFVLIFGSIIFLTRNDRQRALFTSIILMTSPIVMLGYVIHLRQGFALAIFLLILCVLKTNTKNFVQEQRKFMIAAFLASFFHTSFLFILPILGSYKIAKSIFNNNAIALLCVSVVVITLSIAQNILADALGARQAYDRQAFQLLANGFGLGFIFFCGFFLLRIITNHRNAYQVPDILTLAYILLYVTNPIAGRFLLIIYTLIILTLIKSKNFNYYTPLFIGFNLLSYQGTLEQI